MTVSAPVKGHAARRPPSEVPNRMVRQLFLGFVRIHILFHAAEGPVCGVELTEELGSHGYRLSPGTLYPTLHALKEAGYLRCDSRLQQGRLRKCYRITKAGRVALEEAKKRLQELVEEVLEEKRT